jgi:hypothetical protein
MTQQVEGWQRASARPMPIMWAAATLLVFLLTACDSGSGRRQSVQPGTSAHNPSTPATNLPTYPTALDPATVAHHISGASATIFTTVLATAGVRRVGATNWLYDLTGQSLFETPPVHFYRFREAPLWPPQPADYADPAALQLFLERARARPVDTHSPRYRY